MRRSFLPFFVAFLAACPKPTDGDPQIPVTPGAAARINLVGSRAGKTVKSTDGTERAARARAHTMDASPASRLGGPNATGRPGDWVLENDEVVFVIDSLAGGGGFAESGGNLVDAADARLRKDELGQLFTYFGVFPRQALYGSMTGREEPDGTAVVEVKGRELWEPSIEVTTEYRLSGADRALLLRTTLKNTGAQPLVVPGVGDAIVWGGTEKVAPGKGVGFKGSSTGPYIGGIGRFTSYAITSTEGEISAISGTAWTDTEQRKNVPLPVGASVTYERVFVVGERGDLASIVGELTKASGGDLGAVSIKVVDANGVPASVSADAKLVVSTPVVNGKGGEDVMSLVAGKPGDAIEGELPPGRWVLTYAPSAGRRGVAGDKARITVDVKKGAVAKGTVAVTDIATLTVGCSEKDPASGGAVRPLPCKVILEGIDGTSTPDLGPAHVATVARNQIFAVTSPSPQAVPPGKYRLTFSRGPEYAVETAEIALGVGGAASTVAVQKTLSRVVDTSGYVSTDFHQHTSASADSGVAAQDRVLGNVAEAVEVAVVSEHNVVADFTSIAKDLGLTKYVVHVPGDEVTSDSNRRPWGHVNVFPLEVDATKARMGAVPVRDRSPSEVFKDVRALPSPRVIQVNHPRSGSNGYFDLLGFDPKTATATGQGYAADFDALEVWNGRNVEARAKVLDDFMALLRTGHPVTAIADTDTHGVVGHEAGLPRTYVRVSKDDALESWDAARSADLVASVRERRDVVLTNGPFIQVSANGAGIGGVARGPNVDVKVKVTSASFAKVERVDIRFAGSATVAGATSLVMLPKKNAAGAYEAEATFRVRAATDDAFVIMASGSLPMRPMFGGDDKEITPWAMTGAVWIDADGDGKSLGRATPRR